MTPGEWTSKAMAGFMNVHYMNLSDEMVANAIEKAITAAVEEDRKTRPHTFVGRTDRWCELCNEPDRDEIHVASREMMRNRVKLEVEEEREACAKIADVETGVDSYEWCHAAEFIAEQIRARRNIYATEISNALKD